MLPIHSHAPGLVPYPVEQLQALNAFVIQRGLAGVDSAYRELTREFADEFAYIAISARRKREQTRVLLEFGVKHNSVRHCVGFVDGYLDDTNRDIGEIVAVVINGQAVGIDEFVTRLQPLIGLPLMHTEIAETLA